MGTKRHLIPTLTNIIGDCKDGTFLDLFSGMCTVGRAVAANRQVWSNDLQAFSKAVAHSQFCSTDLPVQHVVAPALISPLRIANLTKQSAEFGDLIAEEREAVASANAGALADIFDRSMAAAQGIQESPKPLATYDLFVRRYAGTYFGYEQALEIDSIRFALDRILAERKITNDQWNYFMIALCAAMARCSNSTGHFAQALYPKASNLRKVLNQRSRNIWAEFQGQLRHIFPARNKSWREKNKAFQSDATKLLRDLSKSRTKPSVVYADPPYTQDQYSRYYHIFETAILYDFPTCHGRGLYRPNRATSRFSLASKVEEALDELVASAARLGSCLVLSYPKNGLLKLSSERIPSLIKRHYGVEPHQIGLEHKHSTMGASKGSTSHNVTEIIYRVAA